MQTDQPQNSDSIDLASDVAQSYLGPLVPFLKDPSINFIVANGPDLIYVSPNYDWEQLEQTGTGFEDAHALQAAIQFLVEENPDRFPYLERTLPDGTHITAIAPPIAAKPVLLINKFGQRHSLTIEDWVKFDAITEEAIEFLKAVVRAKLNILICGDRARAALLETLTTFIPDDERIGVLGFEPLPMLEQEHVIPLIPRLVADNARYRITMQTVLSVASQMRLDRLVLDEVRGREAKLLLGWMAAGKNGSLFTIGGANADAALTRLEACCLLEDVRLDKPQIRKLIASAVDLIVLVKHIPDVGRNVPRLAHISEIDPRGQLGDGYHQTLRLFQDPGDAIWLRDIFTIKDSSSPQLRLEPTGVLPLCLKRFRNAGIHLPLTIFRKGDKGEGRQVGRD